MEAKIAAGLTTNDVGVATSELMLNPFVHHLELGTTSEKIKTAFFTVVLLPIRVFLICVLVITGWLMACVALWGVKEEDLQKSPVTGWRRKLTELICILGRITFKVGGMQIAIKGRQASRQEAPILVIAPHSTFLDGGIVYYTGFPSIIVRRESGNNPYMGKLINFTQPIYVWRDDPDSRQNTIREIITRAKAAVDWPQILIFPEGTCTNRSCLITFKPGAFYPGVPIQPVCIRYPNKLDTVTWTWEGPSALKLLWLTLTQVYSSCEIEFLPVYTPSEAEKRDPKLFAYNVRAVMANALGVPVMDYTYDDCKLMTKAKEMNLPHATSLVEVQKLRGKIGLLQVNTEESILNSTILCQDCHMVSFQEFVNLLHLPRHEPATQQLFRLYDTDCTGIIDIREYLLGVLALNSKRNTLDVIQLGFKIYDSTGKEELNYENFAIALGHTVAMPNYESNDIFVLINRNGYVSYKTFVEYTARKAEFSSWFSLDKNESKSANNANFKSGDTKVD